MPEQQHVDEERLLQQLAAVDENPAASVDTTVRDLHTELETLASDVKSSPPADPYQEEAACRRAVDQARSVLDEATLALPPAESSTPLPERLEHFRILNLLGQGGMGAVYLAEDTRLGRQVAIKTLKPDLAVRAAARERFLREARLAATIEHDHIVPIYHVGEADGVPFLAMPFLKGRSLEEMITDGHGLTAVQIVHLGVQIAEGLAAAHENGLIHRDIKPANLWVEPISGGRVKILDFGLARSCEEDVSLTQSGTILGTPSYMPPEQARGEKVDARADLYSLGVVLYRLATGQLPLRGTNTMSMLMSLAMEPPRSVQELASTLPPALAELIMRLLAKDRNQRPASTREVIQTLRGIGESLKSATGDLDATEVEKSVAAPRPQMMAKERKPRRWPLIATGLAGLAALIVAGVIVIIRDRDGKEITRFEVKNGATIEVQDGGQTTRTEPKPKDTKVEPKPIDLAAEKDPQRRAAVWVLSIGGTIQIRHKGQDREIKAAADVPAGSFELVAVDLFQNQQITDAGLVHLKELKGLAWLRLNGTQVTDAGLAHLKELKSLTSLYLGGTRVTDAGLVHLQDLKNLTWLDLSNTRVTDAGLAHIKDLKNLTILDLGFTRVTDAGLVHLKELKSITSLYLGNTQVTDAGLAHLKDLKDLAWLRLSGTKITDVGLVHLKELKNLTHLGLWHTQVTDVGLVHLEELKNLTWLELVYTQVTDVGLVHLKNLTQLELVHAQVTDAGLAHLKDFKNLTQLELVHTQVTDAGLAHLKDLKSLTKLYLNDTQITDAGLVHLKDLKGLQSLRLSGTRVSDLSLTWISAQPGSAVCALSDTRLSRQGYEKLKAAYPKWNLTWSERNHDVAQAVLKLGGQVWIAGRDDAEPKLVKNADDLIRDYFQVRRVSLAGVKQPLGNLPELLARLTDPDWDRLEVLDLTGQAVSDLNFLKDVKTLTDLRLTDAKLNDASLGRLPAWPKLKKLVLDGNDVRVAAVRFLVLMRPQLEELSLARTGFDEPAASQLPGLKELRVLNLSGTPLNDIGLKAIAQLTKLESLDLRDTKVTAAGIAELQKALPMCKITRDGAK